MLSQTRFHWPPHSCYDQAEQDLIAKAGTLLEALPYIQKFNGATFVVQYGGRQMG